MSDYLNTQKAFRFTVDIVKQKGEIDGDFYVEGYASTSDLDRQGDIIVEEALKEAAKDLVDTNNTVFFGHEYDLGNSVGRIVSAKVDTVGLRVRIYVSSWAKELRTKLKEGVINKFSIGGRILKDHDIPREDAIDMGIMSPEDPFDYIKVIDKIELFEVSFVGVPANPHAQVAGTFSKALTSLYKENFKEVIKDEEVLKPYPNEHACRLRDPGTFQPGSFRRVKREHEGKEYSVILGKLKGEDSMTEQAYRYNKNTWTVSQARDHCTNHHGISFEPAVSSAGKENECLECNKGGDKMNKDTEKKEEKIEEKKEEQVKELEKTEEKVEEKKEEVKEEKSPVVEEKKEEKSEEKKTEKAEDLETILNNEVTDDQLSKGQEEKSIEEVTEEEVKELVESKEEPEKKEEKSEEKKTEEPEEKKIEESEIKKDELMESIKALDTKIANIEEKILKGIEEFKELVKEKVKVIEIRSEKKSLVKKEETDKVPEKKEVTEDDLDSHFLKRITKK